MLTFNVVLGYQGPLFQDLLWFFFFKFFFFQSDRPTQYQETHSTVNEEKQGDGLRGNQTSMFWLGGRSCNFQPCFRGGSVIFVPKGGGGSCVFYQPHFQMLPPPLPYTFWPVPKLQIPQKKNKKQNKTEKNTQKKHRTTSAYHWHLGINMPVKTQKCSDNDQNMRIMLALLRFKKWEKLC